MAVASFTIEWCQDRWAQSSLFGTVQASPPFVAADADAADDDAADDDAADAADDDAADAWAAKGGGAEREGAVDAAAADDAGAGDARRRLELSRRFISSTHSK